MSNPITWHNIAAPNFRDSILANQAAGENFNAAGANLQRILAEQAKVNNANFDNQTRIGTEEEIAAMQQAKDLGTFRGQEANFDIGPVRERRGVQADFDKVAAARELLKSKLLEGVKSSAATNANAVADSTKSVGSALEAARQHALANGMTGGEADAFANDYLVKNLASKKAAWAEKANTNTQEFLNSLPESIKPADLPALMKRATDTYGNLINMDQLHAYAERVQKGEDRIFDNDIKKQQLDLQEKQLAISAAEHAANAAARKSENAFRNETLRQTAEEKRVGNIEKLATEGNLSDAKLFEKARSTVDALDKDKNQNTLGWFIPNDSEEEKNAKATIEFERLKAAQNLSTESRRNDLQRRFGSTESSSVNTVANPFKPTQGSDPVAGIVNHYVNAAGQPTNKTKTTEALPSDVTPLDDTLRPDGTKKGPGFLGKLANVNGQESTELSIGVNINGEETLIPSLVPTLSKDEVQWLLKNNMPTPEIEAKAVAHAQQRIAEGKPVFATTEDSPTDPRLTRKIIDQIVEAKSGNAVRDTKTGLWSSAGISDVKEGIQKAPSAIAAELTAGLEKNVDTAKDVAGVYSKYVGKPAEKAIISGMSKLKIQQAKDLAKQRLKNGVLTEEQYYKEILRLSGVK